MKKNEIRQTLRKKRNALSKTQQKSHALKIANKLSRNSIFQRAKHIGFYLPNDGELSLTPLINRSLMKNTVCYLPVICSQNTATMRFVPFQKNTKFKANRYGIPEPFPAQKKRRALALDILCVPLVGFNRRGERIGMGGGFYDRELTTKKYFPRQTVIMGIAHSVQEESRIKGDDWDIDMDMIATEKEIIYTQRKSVLVRKMTVRHRP